jgi:hypothetical protein
MVDSFEDDTDLGKYFPVQRYRANRHGKIALAVYTSIAAVREAKLLL